MKNALYNIFNAENYKTKFANNVKSCRKGSKFVQVGDLSDTISIKKPLNL
jgi:hypothetical protein